LRRETCKKGGGVGAAPKPVGFGGRGSVSDLKGKRKGNGKALGLILRGAPDDRDMVLKP